MLKSRDAQEIFTKFDDSLINELRITRHLEHLQLLEVYGAVIDTDTGTSDVYVLCQFPEFKEKFNMSL